MAFLYSLCSSSKGNSTYIGEAKSGILIDAGIGIRGFADQMKIAQIEESAIKAIFITHEHIDHVRGLKPIAKKLNVPIYGSKETLTKLIEKDQIDSSADLYEINKLSVSVGTVHIKAFATPHDTSKSLGFKITTQDDKSLCYATDLGNVTDTVFEQMFNSDLVFIESNYDEEMLSCGPYPISIKRRIASNNGHLSNEACSQCIARLMDGKTKKFILAHLSQNNNKPELAYLKTVTTLLNRGATIELDYTLDIAPQTNIGKCITI
ncbi:MAG: MBL fold metallo-hydrolase [Oscillospiraceae bacterium]